MVVSLLPELWIAYGDGGGGMKIVIDIPEAVYDQICKEKLDGIMARAIRCGIPLPKGHGRLIDGDELASGCDAPHWCRWLSEIEDAPTIIEAEEEQG